MYDFVTFFIFSTIFCVGHYYLFFLPSPFCVVNGCDLPIGEEEDTQFRFGCCNR